MKKAVFSTAFLAVSGVYVAYANHSFDGQVALIADPGTRQTDVAPAIDLTQSTSSDPQFTADIPSLAQVTPAPIPRAEPAAVAPLPPKSRPDNVADEPAPQPMPALLPSSTSGATATQQLPQRQSTASAKSSANGYSDGSYAGTDENAYYGRVQVQVNIAGGKISTVKVLDYPSDRRTSRSINSRALPMLAREVIKAQNARIDTVSGATLTSEAYIRSLGDALRKAGISKPVKGT